MAPEAFAAFNNMILLRPTPLLKLAQEMVHARSRTSCLRHEQFIQSHQDLLTSADSRQKEFYRYQSCL